MKRLELVTSFVEKSLSTIRREPDSKKTNKQTNKQTNIKTNKQKTGKPRMKLASRFSVLIACLPSGSNVYTYHLIDMCKPSTRSGGSLCFRWYTHSTQEGRTSSKNRMKKLFRYAESSRGFTEIKQVSTRSIQVCQGTYGDQRLEHFCS